MAKKIFKIGELDITIRRAKVKEIKQLVLDIKEQVDNIFGENQIVKPIETVIMDNYSFFESKVIQFTDLSAEQIDDMDLLDLVDVLKTMLEYNGLHMGKLKDFFDEFIKPLLAVKAPISEQELNKKFSTQIPSIME